MNQRLFKFLFLLMTCSGCSDGSLRPSGTIPVRLAPCPDSPNCVSTQSRNHKHAMPPLPYRGTREESRGRLLDIIKKMKRTTVISNTDVYIHVEFKSRILRFVDDVEFLFVDAERLIHFRSASRVGYSDLGVNRKRMQAISRQYLEEKEPETTGSPPGRKMKPS